MHSLGDLSDFSDCSLISFYFLVPTKWILRCKGIVMNTKLYIKELTNVHI